jgi:hypothetical protein
LGVPQKDSFPWHEESCFKSILAASLVGDHVLNPSLVSPWIALFEGIFASFLGAPVVEDASLYLKSQLLSVSSLF